MITVLEHFSSVLTSKLDDGRPLQIELWILLRLFILLARMLFGSLPVKIGLSPPESKVKPKAI